MKSCPICGHLGKHGRLCPERKEASSAFLYKGRYGIAKRSVNTKQGVRVQKGYTLFIKDEPVRGWLPVLVAGRKDHVRRSSLEVILTKSEEKLRPKVDATIDQHEENLEKQVESLQSCLKDNADVMAQYDASMQRRRRTIRALGDGTEAAAAMLDANDPESARAVLVALRRHYLANLREEVSNEPGGVAFEARAKGKTS